LSRPNFFVQFKRTTGLTPAIFLNTLRMESAYRMLFERDRNIIDVGNDLGFEAHSNFTRFFREHMTDGLLNRVDEAFKPSLFVNHFGSSEVYTFTIEP
jgi:methylphosphotriester-DNA--protein-cysteine methyltransferase